MSDWPPKPQNEPTNSNNVTGKEWQILKKLFWLLSKNNAVVVVGVSFLNA
jgi:hypothetical protein